MAIEAIGAAVASAGVEAAKQAAADAARQLADKLLASSAEGTSPQQNLLPHESIDPSQEIENFRIGELQAPDTNDKSSTKAKESEAAEELKNKVEGDQPHDSSRRDGGSYGELAKNRVEGTEIHHMPPASVNELDYDKGPAIRMDEEDHRKTSSYGSSNEAREYRAEQEALIKDGKWREALDRDIADVREKFGDKYDDAIAEMEEYNKTLGC